MAGPLPLWIGKRDVMSQGAACTIRPPSMRSKNRGLLAVPPGRRSLRRESPVRLAAPALSLVPCTPIAPNIGHLGGQGHCNALGSMIDHSLPPPVENPSPWRDHACSQCGSTAIGRSHRRPGERILSLVGILPFRCLQCDHRFLRIRHDAISMCAQMDLVSRTNATSVVVDRFGRAIGGSARCR